MFGYIKSDAFGRADRQPITDARASLVNNKLTPGNNCLARLFLMPLWRPYCSVQGAYLRRAYSSAGAICFDEGGTQTLNAVPFQKTFPRTEFVDRELVALAGIFEGNNPRTHAGDDLSFAPRHPSGGIGRRQIVERLRAPGRR